MSYDNCFTGITLQGISDSIKDYDDDIKRIQWIHIIPDVNDANNILTDEEVSGDEEFFQLTNLPPLLLKSETEIMMVDETDEETDDEENDEENDEKNDEEHDKIPLNTLLHQNKKLKFDETSINWIKEDIVECDLPIIKDECNSEIIPSPIELFSKFIDGKLINLIVHQSNLYAEKKNEIGNITADEIKCFIGILLLSGIYTLPNYLWYWDKYSKLVVHSMEKDRFEFILRHIHLVDNENLIGNVDKFAKVRPLIDILNENFQKYAPATVHHSVGEQLVPYFSRLESHIYYRQHIIPYGYKFWMGATYKGYIVWMEPHQGADQFSNNNEFKEMGVGPNVVFKYADILMNSELQIIWHLYFNQLLTTLPLLEELNQRQLKGTGIIYENHLTNCPLPKNSELKEKERGWYDYVKSKDHNLIVCAWKERRHNIVKIASNVHSVEPALPPERKGSQKPKRANTSTIKQPRLINMHNRYASGVERANENIDLHRISVHGKKWYFPIICHCIDLAVQNAWQLHQHLGGKMNQLKFRRKITTTLLELHGKSTVCDEEIRFDGIDHLLTEIPRQSNGKLKQKRCEQCNERATTRCFKCNVTLHVKCNVLYHTKNEL